MDNKTEVWKSHPEYTGIEVSSFGGVRSAKGRHYSSHLNPNGYCTVAFRTNGKVVSKLVHRLVAEVFVPNPDNLPYVHHKDDDKTNNNASNLDWYTYTSTKEAHKVSIQPVYAINLATLKVSKFPSQHEAGRVLGFNRINIIHVIKDRQKQAHGYLFVTADDTAVDVAKHKLHKLGKTELTTAADAESVKFVSQFNVKSLL